MNKYNCSLIYQSGVGIEARDVTFEKKNLDDIKLPKKLKKEYLKLKNCIDKVDFMSIFLSGRGMNIVSGVGGKLPHKKLTSHTGFWKVEGKKVLPRSYFKTIALKDV